MAEIQIVPAAFNPSAEQQPQANPGAAAGGTATDNQRPDAVVQNIEDVIDLNADDDGNNAAQDRQAAQDLQQARRDIEIRVDYDTEDGQLYVEFVDPRTDITITSVPPRERFDFDPNQIRQQAALDDAGGEALAEPAPVPTAVRQAAPDNIDAAVVVPERLPEPPLPEVARQETGFLEVPQSTPARNDVPTATAEQNDILENR